MSPRKHSPSPWGLVQTAETVAPGITFVTTAGHGGFHLTDDRVKQMPRALRKPNGDVWFEEDCEWGLVVLSFPDLFSKKDRKLARDVVKSYFPFRYEKHYHCKLRPEESHVIRRLAFEEKTKDRYVAVSAINSHVKGFVEVVFVKGGRDRNGHYRSNQKYYRLVSTEDYDAREEYGYHVESVTNLPPVAPEESSFPHRRPAGQSKPLMVAGILSGLC